MIELHNISKSYASTGRSRPAVQGVSLTIRPGEFLALVGPNGSGKSTLLGILAGTLAPDHGEIIGRPRVSVVLQTVALDPLLTIRENATIFARVFGVPGDEIDQRFESLARIATLSDRADDRVGSLSGGLARRADILRAAMTRPELLLLDEPTSGLDRTSQAAVFEMLESLRTEHRVAIVLATHLLSEAESADRVLLLRQGRIIREGSAESFVAELGFSHVLHVTAGDAEAVDLPDAVKYARGGEVFFGDSSEAIRTEADRLFEQDIPVATRAANLADVYDIEFSSHTSEVSA